MPQAVGIVGGLTRPDSVWIDGSDRSAAPLVYMTGLPMAPRDIRSALLPPELADGSQRPSEKADVWSWAAMMCHSPWINDDPVVMTSDDD